MWLLKARERSRKGNLVSCEGGAKVEEVDHNRNGWASPFLAACNCIRHMFSSDPRASSPVPSLIRFYNNASEGAASAGSGRLPGGRSRTRRGKDSF